MSLSHLAPLLFLLFLLFLRFIGHSTWMSRAGSTPNFFGSRIVTRSTTVSAMASGSSAGTK